MPPQENRLFLYQDITKTVKVEWAKVHDEPSFQRSFNRLESSSFTSFVSEYVFNLIFWRNLNGIIQLMLQWSKYDWTIKSIACIVSEILLPRAKWLEFYQMYFENIYVMWVKHLSQHWAIYGCFITSVWDCFFPVHMDLICKKRFH